MSFWVARLDISDKVAQKLRHKHKVEPQDVRDQIECIKGLAALPDDDEEHGFRMVVKIAIKDKPHLAILCEPPEKAEADVWNLKTVLPR